MAAHPSTLPEILAALAANVDAAGELFAGVPDAVLFDGDPEHWSPAHHLDHLTRTSHAVARGLRSTALPAHVTGRSRSYAEVRDAATASLGATPRGTLREMGRVVVIPPGATRDDLVRAFRAASAAVREAAAAWQESELDTRAMTHPLVGTMTVREMLLFMVVHERHHLKRVRARLAAA